LEDQFYFMRFVAHRNTFAQDMTPDERATMGQHVAFWTEHGRDGNALMFGPVIDPQESWGFGVLRARSETEALTLSEKDPANALGRHELFPIPVLIR